MKNKFDELEKGSQKERNNLKRLLKEFQSKHKSN